MRSARVALGKLYVPEPDSAKSEKKAATPTNSPHFFGS